MTERPKYVVTFTAAHGVDGVHALRALLKIALRRFGLVAVDAREESAPAPDISKQIADAFAGLRRDVRERLRCEHQHPHGVRPPRRAEPNQAAGAMEMSLGKRKSSSVFMAVLKYDARAGVFFTQDRVFRDGCWQTEQHDVTDGFQAIFDLANAQIGWMEFPKGAAPNMVLKPVGEDIGERPSADHKEGVRLIVKIPDDDAGPREMLSTAIAVWRAIDALHDAYLAGVDANPGKLPVVVLADVIEVSNPSGISHEPVFEIVGWVPRPTDLPADGIAAQTKKNAPVKSATTAARATRGDMDEEIPF
jgi:hypothetical protein